jgi:hypothetical protein
MLSDDPAHRTADEHNARKLPGVKEQRECVRQPLHGVRAGVFGRVSESRQVYSDPMSASLGEEL